MTPVYWEERVLLDREEIFIWLCKHANFQVASAADDKFNTMAEVLNDNPEAGAKAGKLNSQRKLVIPHFPFILVYLFVSEEVRILRVLHTSRKITAKWLTG